MNELTDQELLALLSVFVTRERAPGSVPDCGKQYSEKFGDALNYIIKTTEKLIELEQNHQVVEETTTFKRINLKFYELVYDWADGKTFADCVIDSGIDEGAVVKMILAVNRVRVCAEQMATVVGDNAMASRLKEMDPLTNRGLVKM
jgi:superfamily II RNA helicase